MEDMAMGPRSRHPDFDALFAAQFAHVTHTVFFILRDRARAEEIAQDAFLRLLQHWRKVSRYDRPDLWVRRVAIREATRERGREVRRAELHSVVGAQPPETPDPATDTATHADVMSAVHQLAPRQRAVVVLFYFEDRPMDEIAEILGCTSSTAWNHLRAARHNLANLMGEVADDVR
jgi:RNA polymerase sigma factor (sigma-70 family)